MPTYNAALGPHQIVLGLDARHLPAEYRPPLPIECLPGPSHVMLIDKLRGNDPADENVVADLQIPRVRHIDMHGSVDTIDGKRDIQFCFGGAGDLQVIGPAPVGNAPEA